MDFETIIKIVVAIIVVLLVIRYIIQKYNILGQYREPVRKALADIDTYRTQEKATLVQLYQVVERFSQQERNIQMQAAIANTSPEHVNFHALAAAYPSLHSDKTYQSLIHSIESLEQSIQQSRRQYNEAVRVYQTLRSQIPYCIIAPIFGFHAADYSAQETTTTVAETISQMAAPPVQPMEQVATPAESLPSAPVHRCPICQHTLHRKTGKFGAYWSCENTQCKADFTDKDGEPVIIECPDCHKGYLRKRTLGRSAFWTCSQYPDCHAKYPDKDFDKIPMMPTNRQ